MCVIAMTTMATLDCTILLGTGWLSYQDETDKSAPYGSEAPPPDVIPGVKKLTPPDLLSSSEM